MKRCPHCQGKLRIIETTVVNNAVRRRRACVGCQRRFTTMELLVGKVGPDGAVMAMKPPFKPAGEPLGKLDVGRTKR